MSTQLWTLADRAGPNFRYSYSCSMIVFIRLPFLLASFFFFDRIEIDESLINGSFNMVFLGRSISFTYRNHVNIAVRYYLIADVNRFCILLVFTI